MLLRSLTFGVWALVAASAVAWGVKLTARPLPVPPGTAVATTTVATAADLTPLFGATAPPPVVVAETAPPPPPESSRFQLIGVVAARHAARAQGVALIAVDGKTPRAYRVGAVVDGELVLQAVHARAATIGPRGGVALVSLELPPLPPPATGVPGAAPAAMPMGAMPAAVPTGAMPAAMPTGAMPAPNGIGPSPTVLGQPVPGAFRSGATFVPATPVGQMPAPVAQPVPPGQPPQPRMRSQRFGTLPAGVVMPPAAPVTQDEAPAAEGQATPDGRNQR